MQEVEKIILTYISFYTSLENCQFDKDNLFAENKRKSQGIVKTSKKLFSIIRFSVKYLS